jgi:large subunit ribosomal protein L20
MVRVTNAVAGRRRTKRLLKRCRGFFGDSKNHLKLCQDRLIAALSFNYEHRKKKKRDFRKLWITRIGIAANINGLSYSKFINGLKKMNCELNRKTLAELAIRDPAVFAAIASQALKAAA